MQIGIDIGGSHIAVGVISKRNNEYIVTEKVSEYIGNLDISEKQDYIITFIPKAVNAIMELKNVTSVDKIGVGVPGEIEGCTVYNANNLGITEIDFTKLLSKYTKNNKNIIVRNDTECAAIAEKQFGKLKDVKNGIFLGIGTGVGLEVFNNNKPLRLGKSRIDFGHTIVEKDGIKCTCGKNGCIERYISMKRLKEILIDKYTNSGYKSEKPDVIVKKEEEKDKQKLKNTLDDYISYVMITIINLIELFKPDLICIGGSFAKLENTIIHEEIIKRLEKADIYTNYEKPKIEFAKNGNNAGMIGSIL